MRSLLRSIVGMAIAVALAWLARLLEDRRAVRLHVLFEPGDSSGELQELTGLLDLLLARSGSDERRRGKWGEKGRCIPGTIPGGRRPPIPPIPRGSTRV